MNEEITVTDLIYEPPEDQRYWVVRAENGSYIRHFKKFGLVSIGHLDEVINTAQTSDQFFKSWKSLVSGFAEKSVREKKSVYQSRAQWSQVEDFAISMSIGDLVLVPSRGSLTVGRVVSEAFTNDAPLSVLVDEGQPYQSEHMMAFRLHRKVQWGPTVPRSHANQALKRALGSHRTVFCADNYWREIHHVLYPFFKRDDQVFFSLRINRLSSISNHAVAKLFAALSEIEAVSRAPAEALPTTPDKVDELVEKMEEDQQLNLRVQAHFMSPGEIWGAATALTEPVLYYLVYSAVFGSSKLGWKGFFDPRKLPSQIGKAAQRAAVLIIERVKQTKTDKALESLQIEENKIDTKPLSDSTNDITDVVVKPKKAASPRARKKITVV